MPTLPSTDRRRPSNTAGSAEHAQQLGRERVGVLGARDAAEQHRELVAAEAADRVGLRHGRGDALRRPGCSSRSPAAWPSVSLISLKWSRSTMSSADCVPRSASAAIVRPACSCSRLRLPRPVSASCDASYALASACERISL